MFIFVKILINKMSPSFRKLLTKGKGGVKCRYPTCFAHPNYSLIVAVKVRININSERYIWFYGRVKG